MEVGETVNQVNILSLVIFKFTLYAKAKAFNFTIIFLPGVNLDCVVGIGKC